MGNSDGHRWAVPLTAYGQILLALDSIAALWGNVPLWVADDVWSPAWSSVLHPVLLEGGVVVDRSGRSRKPVSGGMSCCEQIDKKSELAGYT